MSACAVRRAETPPCALLLLPTADRTAVQCHGAQMEPIKVLPQAALNAQRAPCGCDRGSGADRPLAVGAPQLSCDHGHGRCCKPPHGKSHTKFTMTRAAITTSSSKRSDGRLRAQLRGASHAWWRSARDHHAARASARVSERGGCPRLAGVLCRQDGFHPFPRLPQHLREPNELPRRGAADARCLGMAVSRPGASPFSRRARLPQAPPTSSVESRYCVRPLVPCLYLACTSQSIYTYLDPTLGC